MMISNRQAVKITAATMSHGASASDIFSDWRQVTIPIDRVTTDSVHTLARASRLIGRGGLPQGVIQLSASPSPPTGIATTLSFISVKIQPMTLL
jgi:hypothetical protein